MSGVTGRSRGRPRKNPNSVATPTTANIASFTRVSKHTTLGQDVTDKKIIQNVEVHDVTPTSTTPSARKRKAARSPEPEEVVTTTSKQPQILSVIAKSTKKQKCFEQPASEVISLRSVSEEQPPSTPRRTATRKRALSPEIESPRTKEAGSLFKRLRIAASPAFSRKASPLTTTQTSTPATSVIPDSEDENDEFSAATTPEPEPEQALPQELLDIVSLYTAFLKTITVHYAHNGTNTPVDLRDISQAVSLTWGKRRISLADIRRCVGIMDVASSVTKSPFYLVDYGNKKTCVELQDGYHGRPLDEGSLVSVFESNLRGIWQTLREAAAGDMTALVLGLPKAPVQSREALTTASAMLAKGKRAMEELRTGIAAREQDKEAIKAASTAQSNADGAPAPKLSLLERLRLKETHLAQLAATGPTAVDLERRGALQRADDVAAVIAMLAKASAGGGARASFTMPTLLQKLKDSLRLPISKDEGAACIRLLAREVAPEWLKIVVVAGKENVVVQMGMAPSSGVLVERVKRLSG